MIQDYFTLPQKIAELKTDIADLKKDIEQLSKTINKVSEYLNQETPEPKDMDYERQWKEELSNINLFSI